MVSDRRRGPWRWASRPTCPRSWPIRRSWNRVIANLTANAPRYSPHRSPPPLTASARGDRIELRIIDRGPGIPQAERDRAFLPFQRLGDNSTTTGVGLGLTVSRGLTEAMGGTLQPQETPSGGLTMTISLPAAPRPTYHRLGQAKGLFLPERAVVRAHAATAAGSNCPDRRFLSLSFFCAAGQDAVEPVAGADTELGEDLVQVVFDGARAHEQLGRDLGVRQAVSSQPGNLGLPGGELGGDPGGPLPDALACGTQLARGSFRESVGTHACKHLVCGAQLLAGVDAPVCAAQPLTVEQMSAPEFPAQAGRPAAGRCPRSG
jgi:hypothetical protein